MTWGYRVTDAGRIKLICLDLDGTALDFDEQHCWLADDLVEVLNALGPREVQWCTNSGRNHQSQFGLVQACRPLRNMPVALLAGERFIYWLQPHYAPHEPFNTMMEERMADLYPRVQQALAPHRKRLDQTYQFNFETDDEMVPGWNLVDEAQVPALVADLEKVLGDVPDAQVLCNGTWVVITHATAGKGVVLEEVARHLLIPRQSVLAIGDHLNDLDMLDGRAAAHVGCPADADQEIIEAVKSAGGMVSDKPHTTGTAQILRRCLDIR